MIKICKYCGKEFEPIKPKLQKFCSKECSKESRAKSHYCVVCGKEIRHTKAITCSKECHEKHNKKERVGEISKCAFCGSEYIKYHSRSKYCSKECTRRANIEFGKSYKKRVAAGLVEFRKPENAVANVCCVCGGVIPDKKTYKGGSNYTICKDCLPHTKLKIPSECVYHGKAKNPIFKEY